MRKLTESSIELRHEDVLKSERRPDYVVIPAVEGKKKISPLYGLFAIELKLADLTINDDDQHVEKLITYNDEVLSSHPSRGFITSVLTNLETMVLVKSTRGDTTAHQTSQPIEFWTDGIKCLKQMLDSPLDTAGYSDDFNFFIHVSQGY